jgi:hypothetical protein
MLTNPLNNSIVARLKWVYTESMDKNKNKSGALGDGWPSKFEVVPGVGSLLSHVGRFLGAFVTAPHLLASHGDHEFLHPLDKPIEPVVDWSERLLAPDMTLLQEFRKYQETHPDHYEVVRLSDTEVVVKAEGNHTPWDVA